MALMVPSSCTSNPSSLSLPLIEPSVLQRVVQCRGVHIVSIGNNECEDASSQQPQPHQSQLQRML